MELSREFRFPKRRTCPSLACISRPPPHCSLLQLAPGPLPPPPRPFPPQRLCTLHHQAASAAQKVLLIAFSNCPRTKYEKNSTCHKDRSFVRFKTPDHPLSFGSRFLARPHPPGQLKVGGDAPSAPSARGAAAATRGQCRPRGQERTWERVPDQRVTARLTLQARQ